MVHHPKASAGGASTAAMSRFADHSRSQTSLMVGVHRPKELGAAVAASAGGGGAHHCYEKAADGRPFVDLGSMSETSRSSTPVTDASTTYQTPSSVSSWGTTSGSQEAEIGDCNFPGDDEKGSRRGDRWDSESNPRSRSRRPSEEPQSFSPAGMRPVKPEKMSGRPEAEASPRKERSVRQSQGSEGDEEEEEDDDDWSGEDDTIDAAVIAAVNGDLALAAYLIPLLHKSFNSAVRNKVESWQCGNPGAGAGSASGGPSGSQRPGSSSTSGNLSPTSPRKKRRRTSSGDGERIGDGDGGDDEDGGRSPNGHGSPLDAATEGFAPLLACPFHKLNPLKYGIQHGTASRNMKNDYYRACAGPGFKTIQRLKEHLKRKHTVVQCARCYTIFKGKDGQEQLAEHYRKDVPCQMGDPALREGISATQWEKLDKQNRKQPQEQHKVEKWSEIWEILFPNNPKPSTPWYDGLSIGASAPTQEDEDFGNIFVNILSHKVRQGDIALSPDGNTMDRLKNVVQQTFRTYFSLRGATLQTDASSSSVLTGSRSNGGLPTSSLVGGSSTHFPQSASAASQPLTTGSSAMSLSPQAGAGGLRYHIPVSAGPPPQQPPPQQQYIGIPMSRQPSQYVPAPMQQVAGGPPPGYGPMHHHPQQEEVLLLAVQPAYGWQYPAAAAAMPAVQQHPGFVGGPGPHQMGPPAEYYGDGTDFGVGGGVDADYSATCL